ncbi:hypothetical protein J3F84DRAFT_361942 [Trichoderma pleuroticola]
MLVVTLPCALLYHPWTTINTFHCATVLYPYTMITIIIIIKRKSTWPGSSQSPRKSRFTSTTGSRQKVSVFSHELGPLGAKLLQPLGSILCFGTIWVLVQPSLNAARRSRARHSSLLEEVRNSQRCVKRCALLCFFLFLFLRPWSVRLRLCFVRPSVLLILYPAGILLLSLSLSFTDRPAGLPNHAIQ